MGAEWVLFRAEERGLPSWLRRSAVAHTLIIGGACAVLLVATAGRVVAAQLPQAFLEVRVLLAAAAVASFLPLPLSAWRHARERVTAIDVDPAGLTLHTPKGPVHLRIEQLADVAIAAEPVFGARREQRARGRFAQLPTFVAALRLRAEDGRRWEFWSSRREDVEGLLSWLDVLGAGARVRRFPSALAAKRTAAEGLQRAERLLALAIGGCAASLALQLVDRVQAGAFPHALAGSLAAVAVGCLLYLASYRSQAGSARAWLASRGLGGAPPLAEPGLAEAPALAAPR